MLKSKRSRMILAAIGGASLMAGVGTTGTAAAAIFHAVLNGDKVSPKGDPDGWGRAKIRIDDALNAMCVDLEVRSVGDVTSAQIFRGAEGTDGKPVVKIDTPDDNDSDDCDAIGDTLADQIQASPADYYVLVTTREHPHGALRGQLAPGGD